MNRDPLPISRRHWLFGTLAIGLLGADDPPKDPRIEAIRVRGRKAEMQGFDESESAHYLAIGDAHQRFREEALTVTEAVAADYFKSFKIKGFELAWPKEKLVVVVLLGPRSYAEYQGAFIDEAIGGHYDLKDNELVMFDFRGRGANPKAPVPEQDNTLALVHETVHQLTFNTGLLELQSDIPLCIIEGLATYAETWAPRRKRKIGERNVRRLLGYDQAIEQGVKWIPLTKLLGDDKLFDEKNIQQMAYAESWLLVSRLLNNTARLPKFRDYLAALREKPDPARRIEIATEHLGDLDKLDKEIRPGR